MRGQDEIVARVAAADADSARDPFGWQREIMVGCLDFAYARPFLVADATEDEWAASNPTLTDDAALAQVRDYMAFAWGKVADHRALSASRSIEKLIAWLWVLGNDALLVEMETTPFAQYGAPRLRVVSEAYGWPVPDDEPTVRMIDGLKCRDNCDEGCGQF